MNWLKNISRMFVACVLVALAIPANAQVEKFVAGTHYTVIPDNAALQDWQTAGSKPQVTEIFWYGCPHCYAFDSVLDAWVAGKGNSIAFARTPMVWNSITEQHARMFFTAKALGIGDGLHKTFFSAIHQQHATLRDAPAVEKLFVAHGIAADRFNSTFRSFGVDTALRKQATAMAAMNVPSVPAMLVNGRYLVHIDGPVATHEDMLAVVDFLLAKAVN